MERMRVAVLASLSLVLLLGACGGDDDEAAEPTTTVASETTTSTSAGPTTSASPSTSERCDIGDAPAARGQLTYGGIDLGGADTAYAYQDDEGAWHLRVDLDDDRGSADELLTTVPSDTATFATGRDLDGDGTDELFVVVGNGAAAQIYGIFDLDGCDLEPVQLDGRPAELAVGGSVVELHGLRCEDDGLTVLTATSDDGVDYTTDERTYALAADGTLRQTDAATGTTTTAAADFPALSQFDC